MNVSWQLVKQRLRNFWSSVYAMNVRILQTLGYNSGKVLLVDVENHQVLHTLELKGEIVSINWTQNTKESYDDFDDLQGNTKLVRRIRFLFFNFVQQSATFKNEYLFLVCQRTQSFSCIFPQFQLAHFKHSQTWLQLSFAVRNKSIEHSGGGIEIGCGAIIRFWDASVRPNKCEVNAWDQGQRRFSAVWCKNEQRLQYDFRSGAT